MTRADVDRLVTLACAGNDPDAVAALLRVAQREGDAAAVALGTLLAGGPEAASWDAATSVLEDPAEAVAHRAATLCRDTVASWPPSVPRVARGTWLPSPLSGAAKHAPPSDAHVADADETSAHSGHPELSGLANAIRLDGASLDEPEPLATLCRAVTLVAAPLHLELTGCELTDSHLRRLLDAIAGRRLHRLALRRNRITSTGLETILTRADALGLRTLDLGENPLRGGTVAALERSVSTLERAVLPLNEPASWTALATAPTVRNIRDLSLERPLPRAPDGVEVWRAVERDPLLHELLVARGGVVSRAVREALDAVGEVDDMVEIQAPAGAMVLADGVDVPLDGPSTSGIGLRIRPGALGLRPRSSYTVRVTCGPLDELERVFLGESALHRVTFEGGLALTGGQNVWSHPLFVGTWWAFVSAVRRDAAPSGLQVPNVVVQLLPAD